MKIEHITLGGNSVIRDTADILSITKRYFSAIDIAYESRLYTIPKLPFKIKITAAEEGAMFDIQVEDFPAIVNVCCFEERNSDMMMQHINQMADMFIKFMPGLKMKNPSGENWIYSVIVNPMALTPLDMVTAGEVELYIYERLYQAWKRK